MHLYFGVCFSMNMFQTAHEEMRNLFRFGGRGQGHGQAPARRGSSSRGTNQRYRPYTQQASAGKAIDVVLLLTPNESSTIRGQNRARLHKKGCIIDKFFYRKSWQSEEVTRRLQDAFADRLNDGSSMSFQILKPEGQTLVVPRLAQGEKMSGAKVCDIFAQKTMYLRPERRISVDTSDEEDNDMPDPFLGPSTSSSPPSLAHASSSSRSALGSTAPQRTSALTSSVSTAQCAPPTARACPQCTFLNSSNTDYCEICEATLSPSVSSVSQSVCQVLPSSGDDPSQQSRKLKNPASLIQDFISLIHFNNKPTNNLYVH
ncbi:uncharacterized protein [Apostichopus japonicus]|uniref:uncharacterized protein isoform X2 n=1 Tax=Stichopus japonicus TaxID=307972 RepID=UPI003AB1C687